MQNRCYWPSWAAFACFYSRGSADDEPIGGWVWGIYGGAAIPDPNELTPPNRRITHRLPHWGSHRDKRSLGYATVEGETGSGITKTGVMSTRGCRLQRLVHLPAAVLSFTIGAGPGWAWNDGSLTNTLATCRQGSQYRRQHHRERRI
jgi:hypothetical protein